jgi:hypothetical protein
VAAADTEAPGSALVAESGQVPIPESGQVPGSGPGLMNPLPSAEPSMLRSQADLFTAAMRMIRAVMAKPSADPCAVAVSNAPPGREQAADLVAPAGREQAADLVAPAGQVQAADLVASPGREQAAEILVCHAFAVGGASGESERVFLGTAELVDPGLFDAFDYAALGHLHRAQPAGSKGWYAGSPIAYAFGEGQVERGYLVVDVCSGSFTTELRRITPLRRMVRVSGTYDQVLQDPCWRDYEGDYIETILDDADAILNPMGPLRERFPFLLSLRQAAFDRVRGAGSDQEGSQANAEDVGGTLAADDFVAFHQEMRGCPPEAALMELFSRLYSEAANETA